MAVEVLYSKIELDGEWSEVTAVAESTYLIAVKDDISPDTIDPKIVKRMNFEIGIDSGIDGHPVSIGRIALNFEDFTSFNEEINERTAFIKLTGVPVLFYIRPINIVTDKEVVTSGETNIKINVNNIYVEGEE